jgi:hypothetical protein
VRERWFDLEHKDVHAYALACNLTGADHPSRTTEPHLATVKPESRPKATPFFTETKP